MRSSWARITSATAVAAVVTAGAAVGAGTAVGSAQPIVVGSCATSVTGAPGTPVELSAAGALQPIDTILNGVPLIGSTVSAAIGSAFANIPPIPIGALPNGTGTITGASIASAVTTQLQSANIPLLGQVIGTLQTGIAKLCSVGVTGINAAAATVQQGASTINSAAQKAQQQLGIAPKSGSTSGGGGTPSQQGASGGSNPPAQQGASGASGGGSGLPASNSPVVGGLPTGFGDLTSTFGPGALLDYGLAESPLARYAGIPFASAGLFDPAPGVKYGGDVPGYAPTYGQLGQQNGTPPDGVQTAGQAIAYNPGGSLGNGVGLPMLLAVLALAGVTAALVRTWVLRKVRSA